MKENNGSNDIRGVGLGSVRVEIRIVRNICGEDVMKRKVRSAIRMKTG